MEIEKTGQGSPMSNGAYDLEGVIYHQHSNKLMKKILELWPDKSVPVVDLGCGHNFYLSVMVCAGYKGVGMDDVTMYSQLFLKQDVTAPIRRPIPLYSNTVNLLSDDVKINVLSLEVGEHIPEDKAAGYLDNLTSFGGDIIMSWAVPGQPGHGHINCQPFSWVLEQMINRGYDINPKLTDDLRLSVQKCHCTWFQNTLMYFTPAKKWNQNLKT